MSIAITGSLINISSVFSDIWSTYFMRLDFLKAYLQL
jgi:hypothetical protein